MYTCNNNRNCGGLFGGNSQAFWIAVVIAFVVIWLHCGCGFGGSCGCGDGCGCQRENDCCC